MNKPGELYRQAGIILAYAILILLMTYPLVENFFSYVPGRGFDVYTFLWNFWWVKKALLELHTTPYYSNYVAYPAGEDLALRTFNMFNCLAAIPLQEVFNLAATYNILFFASFLLSAYGTYALVRYLTGDSRAAFISGLMFAFCPYRFIHALAGQLNLLSTGFLPLYALYLIKTDTEKGWKNPMLAAVFFLANALCDWHYMCHAIVFSVVYFSYRLWFEDGRLTMGAIERCSFMLALSAMLTLPFAYPIIESALFVPREPVAIEFSVTMSADVLSFFVPSQMHPLLSGYFAGIHRTFTGFFAEADVSLGFTAIALTLYHILRKDPISSWAKQKIAKAGAIKGDTTTILSALCILLLAIVVCFFVWQSIDFYLILSVYTLFFIVLFYAIKDRAIGFWLFAAIAFFILALGPIPHILGQVYYVPLPYIVFPYLPILSFLRDPGRFGILVMLSVSVLSGYAISDLLSKVKKRDILTIAVSAVVLFEFLVVPLPTTALTVPKFYDSLAESAGDFGILDFPIPSYFGNYMYYQTKHEKKMVGGYVGIYSIKSKMFLTSTPVIQAFKSPLLLSTRWGDLDLFANAYFRPDPEYDGLIDGFFKETNASFLAEDFLVFWIKNSTAGKKLTGLDQPYAQGDIIIQNLSRIGKAVLNHYNIRYIIVHKSDVDAAEKGAIMKLISEILPDSAPYYEDEGLTVYEIPETKPIMFATLGSGWYPKDPIESTATRWMEDNATIRMINTKDGSMRISFETKSLQKNRTLVVHLNTRPVGEYTIGTDYTQINITGLKADSGNNTITFQTTDACTQQNNRYRTTTEAPTQCKSFAFRNISIASDAGI